jgi:hypothetical protein
VFYLEIELSTEETAAPITSISIVEASFDGRSTASMASVVRQAMQRRQPGSREVSNREFSRMSPETKAVVFAVRALYDWQDWQKYKSGRALGFPSSSAFADGYKGKGQASSIVPDCIDDEMPAEHKDILDALNSLTEIRRKVVEGVHKHRLEFFVVARKINTNEKRVRNLIREAYMTLAGFMRGRGRL